MLDWNPKAGDAFLVPSGPSGSHLFIVLNDPDDFSNFGYGKHLCVVSVNFSSVGAQTKFDQSCIVQTGDHPFITRESYAYYQGLRMDRASDIKKHIDSGAWQLKEKVSQELLDKLREGLQTSTYASREFKKILSSIQ